MVDVLMKARHERRKSSAAYAPLRGVMGVESGEKVKMEERLTPGGSRIEFFCTAGGPSLESLMEPIYRLATDSMLAKISQTPTAPTSSGDTKMLSSLSKDGDSK